MRKTLRQAKLYVRKEVNPGQASQKDTASWSSNRPGVQKSHADRPSSAAKWPSPHGSQADALRRGATRPKSQIEQLAAPPADGWNWPRSLSASVSRSPLG